MKAPASNRQKKVLRFFDVPFHETITAGAAGWELGTIFSDETNSERWRKYLFLTKDFDSESDELVPFDAKELDEIEVPEEWSASVAIQAFRENRDRPRFPARL